MVKLYVIEDAKREFSKDGLKLSVVAPRILLANQLSSEFLELIDDVDVLHVHSGETHTPVQLRHLRLSGIGEVENQLIFTTYHSYIRYKMHTQFS